MEMMKKIKDANNNVVLTSIMFYSSPNPNPEYFKFKNLNHEDFLNNYQNLEINSLYLESEFIITKNLLSKSKN